MSMSALRLALLPISLLVLASCHNACQDVCVEMARYAENECGYSVPDAEVDACIDRQAGAESRDDRQACRQGGNRKTIDEEWGCEELADYFEE